MRYKRRPKLSGKNMKMLELRSMDVSLDHTGTFAKLAKIPSGIRTGKCGQMRKPTALWHLVALQDPWVVVEHIRLWLVVCVDIFGGLIQRLHFPNGQSQYLLLPVTQRSRVPSISCGYQIYLPCRVEHGISALGLPNAYPATAISPSPDVTGTFAFPARIRLNITGAKTKCQIFLTLSQREWWDSKKRWIPQT